VWWQFASVVACYAGITGIIVLAGIEPFSWGEQGQAYHDTYYVVRHGNYVVSIAGVMGIFAVISWLQKRYGAMLYPKTTLWLFWGLHLASLTSLFGARLALGAFDPENYISYVDRAQTIFAVTSSAGAITLVSISGLTGLAIWSAFAKWQGK